ncbi:O-antigen ligase [Bacillus sp. FJAT-27445]|uniref:O-antigen ligase family protein n=1 Tax=Bacillus sp. FJAT-27445 TaxID=1679166 RepID=UPI0012E34C08|nr:O-antigen ligase family protein [Bacillus sp. FJAT-27445]
MYSVKHIFIKAILIGLLALLLGWLAIAFPQAMSGTSNLVFPFLVLASIAGLFAAAFLLLLRWEHHLFIFALSAGFQLYDPSPYELMFFILVISVFIKRVQLNRDMFKNVLALLLYIFLFFGTVSLFFAANFSKAAVWHGITVFLVCSGLFLVLAIKNDKHLEFFLKGYIAGAVANSVLGIAGYVSNKNLGNSTRLEGFFQDPNIFSPYLIIALLLVLEDSLNPKLFASRSFKYLSIALLAGAVVLAMSRAGWINLAGSLAVYLAIKMLKGELKPSFVIKSFLVPSSLLVSVYFLFPAITNQFIKLLVERTTLQTYDNERFNAQLFAVKVLKSNYFGIGPGEMTSIYYMDPHNTYLRLFAEYGWIAGISLLLLLVIQAGFLIKRSISCDKNKFNFHLVLLCSMAGSLVNILVVDALHWRHFWILFGLCCYAILYQKDESAEVIRTETGCLEQKSASIGDSLNNFPKQRG